MRKTHGFCSGADAESPESRGTPPLTAAQAAAAQVQREELTVSAQGVFWLESDPALGGTLIAGIPHHHAPWRKDDLMIRSRINSYGGGALCAADQGLYAVTENQQIAHLDASGNLLGFLTGKDSGTFGGLVADNLRQRVLAVREQDNGQQLVAVSDCGELQLLHQGQDFYSAPALSGDGRRIAWISWQLPDMPWERSVLWTATVAEDGSLEQARCWQTPREGNVQQPVFAGDDLWLLSDHDGWWQPYRFLAHGQAGQWLKDDEPELDHANAPWQLGESHHCLLPDNGWARVRYCQGSGELWLMHRELCVPVRLAQDYRDFRCLQVWGGHVYCIARSPLALDAILQIHVETGDIQVLAGGEQPPGHENMIAPASFVMAPEQDTDYPVQGFLYCPEDPDGGPFPLILIAHGGPTSAAYPVFNPQVQYWCQQGYAVAEVNYRGSTGFGRGFRMALAGCWGVVDVEDMEQAADFLVRTGVADADRVFIQGRSSGGYSALMALIHSRRFAAGASLYGVSDPLRLRAMTHRFESGYLDWLLGAPESFPERWRERTPLYRASEIRAPVIFFQGGQDPVVVPEQTRTMVAAMEAAGGRPVLKWFGDEGHGFRHHRSQTGVLEELLAFYREQAGRPR